MDALSSPIFSPEQLAVSTGANSGRDGSYDKEGNSLVPRLPDKPLALTSSVQVYIITTEKRLFLQGFSPEEFEKRAPTLLRGCLYFRVLKPSKIKSISLTFRGQQRTEWPEGIPPRRSHYYEANDIVSHTWPFYQIGNPMHVQRGGADFYLELPQKHDSDGSNSHGRSRSSAHDNEGGRKLIPTLSPAAGIRRRTSIQGSQDQGGIDLNPAVTHPDVDINKPGHFPVGDYIYNFEHPIEAFVPESTLVTFGSVSYFLEANITRLGAFKSNITTRLPIDIVRIPSEDDLEETEPIIINREWEDQLQYDIVIGRKAVVLDSYLPLAFRFIPLFGKVSLYRIRVYLVENLEYYCHDRKVHRLEPQKKYLLLEHKAKKDKSLLTPENRDNNIEEDEVIPKELEFQLFVPKVVNNRSNSVIHPDTSFTNIQAHHWIKICLRLSKLDPSNPNKRKHYEILIDSPIHILSSLATRLNTILPAYDEQAEVGNMRYQSRYQSMSPPLSPDVTHLDNSGRIIPGNGPQARNFSLDEMVDDPPEFLQLNNDNQPFERDQDMHLEANLYKPRVESRRLASPSHPEGIGTPIARPIHLLRQPSINPPTFEESSMSPILQPDSDAPPAYEDDHQLNLSPLRIDDGGSEPATFSNQGPELPRVSVNDTPVKNLLMQQLGSKPDNRRARRLSTGVSDSERSSKSVESTNNQEVHGSSSNFSSLPGARYSRSRDDVGGAIDPSSDKASGKTSNDPQDMQNRYDDSETGNSDAFGQNGGEKRPSVDSRIGEGNSFSSLASTGRSSKKRTSKSVPPFITDVSNSDGSKSSCLDTQKDGNRFENGTKDASWTQMLSPAKLNSEAASRQGETNLESLKARDEGKDSTEGMMDDSTVSETSSIVDEGPNDRRSYENGSVEYDLAQRVPLLNPSSTSLGPYIAGNSANSSGVSLANEYRNMSRSSVTQVMDLVDNQEIGGAFYKIDANLQHLKNPRISKHYETENEYLDCNDVSEKQRQRSIGVVNHSKKYEKS